MSYNLLTPYYEFLKKYKSCRLKKERNGIHGKIKIIITYFFSHNILIIYLIIQGRRGLLGGETTNSGRGK